MVRIAERAVIVGIDGASMEIVKRMVEAGKAPNISRLMKMGVHREMWGVLPTLTPTGWTSLSTGAWPGTHGIADFNIHLPGEPLSSTHWGIDTRLCRAEYLWNTAERAGRVPVLVKWEMSWPPTVRSGVQVEGAGPGPANYHQVAGYHLFSSCPRTGMRTSLDAQEVDPSVLREEQRLDPIQLRPAANWRNAPATSIPALEAELVISPLARGTPHMLRGKKAEPRLLFALVYGAAGCERVRITRSRDGDDAVADLALGEWSEWVLDTFVIDGDPVQGHLRFKILRLNPSGEELEIFVPQVWPNTGYTFPDSVAMELLENVGPFLQNPGRDAMGAIDDDTYFELLEYHHDWLAKSALYLTSNRKWDLLFVETHASDFANHYFLGEADPVSGAPPDVVAQLYDGVVRTYASIDRLVGRLMELLDGQTVMALVSDHGGTPSRFAPTFANDVLEEVGLLTYGRDAAGRRTIDWELTRAANVGVVNIFVNLKGREKDGIVDPDDYEEVRRQVIDALHDYRDPTSGLRPFVLALRREDAEALNLWGEETGDVVYALHPDFDAAHGHQLPSARLGIGGQHSTFILVGPGVRKDVHLRRQVRHVDVAPTLAHLLGMPAPRDCEGSVTREALEDPDWYVRR